MTSRLEMLRKSPITKNAIDAVFLRNKQMLGVTDDDVMREPYKKSDLVYICISTTSKAISQVPLIVVRNSGSDGEYRPLPTTDPWSQLFSRPNYITDRYSFVESIITYLLHDGEVFIVPYPPGLGPPGSLWVVRNKFIRPMKDPKTNLLLGWLYNQSGQFTEGNLTPSTEGIPLHVDEVARVYLFNPYDPLKGMSPLEAGKMSIVVDYKASFYSSVFFDEGASPGGVISTESKLGDKQFSRVKEQFEARHQGFKKAHRIAVLEQGLKYTQTGLNQKDMEFGDLRKLNAERIYQVFGMKKAVVSVMEDINYATSREEIKLWWEGTNLPLMSLTTSALNFILFNQNSELKLMFDITTVAALKEALKEKVETGYKMWQMGFTANEVNRRLDMGFGNKPWRDVWFVPVNLQPVDRALNPPKPVVPELPPPPVPPLALPSPKPPKALTEGEEEKLTDKDEIRGEQSWNNFIQKTASLEEKFEKKVTRVFMDMRKRSLDSLYKSTKAPKDLDEELFSEASKNISRFTDPLYGDAVIVGFTTMLEDIGSSIVFSLSDPEALAFLAMKNIQIKGIIQTIKDQIRVELMEAYEQGDTIDEIAARIRNVFNVSNSRARTIARTEILGAAGEGRSLAINRSGYREKRWFTAMDERVRPQHRAMHGRTVKVGHMWVLPDGTSLRYPGDSNGPAHQVINCFINPFVPILTSEGWKPIKDISVGDLVLTHKNRFREVESLSPRRRYQGDVIRIYPDGKKQNAITVTPEHPILIGNEWKKAEDVKVGDKLQVLSSYCNRCGEAIPYWKKYCSHKCNSLNITDRQWADPNHRELMSKKTTEQLNREYSNGTRDRYEVGRKAREVHFEKYGFGGYVGSMINSPEFRGKIKEGVEKKYGSYLEMLKATAFPALGKASQNGSKLEKIVREYLEKQERKFIPQFCVGKRRVDFYLPDEKVFVEADGPTFHDNPIEERKRDLEILMEYPDHKISHVVFGDGPIRWETFDLLTLNHAGTFSQIEISIQKVERKRIKKPVRLFNFSVREDESYMAKGIVVHNCRCIETVIFESHYLLEN